jgi:hypothetical protein
MCWSATASLALGTSGLGIAAIAHERGSTPAFTIPLAYFSLMEFIQYFSYATIDQCALSSNTTLTLLSYVHIALQPVFFNMILMAGVPGGVAPRMRRRVYALSLLASVVMLLKLVPIQPATLCAIGESLCGQTLCTVSGNWHLAWQVPYFDAPLPGDIFYYYAAAIFIMPLFYGAWMGSALAFVSGPILAYFLARGNPNEWPAIWCFYSVALVFVAFTPQMRTLLSRVRADLDAHPIIGRVSGRLR